MAARKPLAVPCSSPGCKNKVPVHELPLDRTCPAFCDPCLRAATPAYIPKGAKR